MVLSPFVETQPQKITSAVAMEPIHNVLFSMSLLTSKTLTVERETWLAETAGRLRPSQQHTNRLLFTALGAALLPDDDYADFPAYLDGLATIAPDILRDRVLQRLIGSGAPDEKSSNTQPMPTANTLLANVQRFLEQVARVNATTAGDASQLADRGLFSQVYQLLKDPPAMQRLIIAHLQSLWETEFAAEWEKTASMMGFIAQELNSRSWPTGSAGAVIGAFSRRAMPDFISAQLVGVQHIVFVPSPYLRLQAARFGSPNTLRIFMAADFSAWPLRTEPIKRGEVLGPAQALADDVRLRILELLAAYEALRAQEIIAHLNVSQPTVSRHLKQLRNAKFITEAREKGANKIYRLNRERIGEVTHSLTQLLSAENAWLVIDDVRPDQPLTLRPFLDRNGLVTTWPAKQKRQNAVLAYLGTKFVIGEVYTEAQVNALLNQWHTYGDPAYLRRELVDRGYLNRTDDGAEYWRTFRNPSAASQN